jgi:hypothetical protein
VIAVTRQTHVWGSEALFALAAHSWFGADVIDLEPVNSHDGPLLLLSPTSPRWGQQNHTTLARSSAFARYAEETWRLLATFEQTCADAGNAKPIGHALQWLRLCCVLGFRPTDIHNALNKGDKIPGFEPIACDLVNLPRSRDTIQKVLNRTLVMAEELSVIHRCYLSEATETRLQPGPGWNALGPSKLDAKSTLWGWPPTRAARSFLEAMFNFLVYEDLDEPWAAYSQKISDNAGATRSRS